MPFCTHCCIADQISSSPARVSASGRQADSLASITPLTGRPDSAHRASNSAPEMNR